MFIPLRITRSLLAPLAHFATGLLLISTIACSSPDGSPTPGAGKNYVNVTLNGQTKTYTNVKLDSEGTVGALTLWTITAGSDNEQLQISMWGSGGGKYPYKPTIDSFKQVSQIEYRTSTGVLANYAALVCPGRSGYYANAGEVNVTQYTNGKVAKGTFSGALLSDQDGDNCNTKGTSFNGEFSIGQ